MLIRKVISFRCVQKSFTSQSRWLNAIRNELIGSEEKISIQTDKEINGVYVMTMSHPEKKNAMSYEMINPMRESIRKLHINSDVRALVLRSALPGVFCAGADLKERLAMSNEQVENFVDGLRSLTNELHMLPFPTIAAINGFALGGGLEIALACDLRVASSRAKMGLVETKWALLPGAGGSQRLSRIIGLGKAKDMIYGARIVDSEEALRIGLIEYAVEQEDNEDAATKRALIVARDIASRGPLAMRAAKFAIDKGIETDLQTGLAIEKASYGRIIPTKDRIEGLKAFSEKRTPAYKGE
ncbi:methylglutaconyl-CoA hydratase, mitochondrial-like [Brevipalpus obovatus]|uniref:methylglutaconyl-CoA hydratase, mitochondrial-like n=1 Tax=Brevipalpus obovatus TaxID=246614 RepID=UPI003D9E69DB